MKRTTRSTVLTALDGFPPTSRQRIWGAVSLFVFQIAPHINFKFFDKSNSHLRLEDIGKQTDDGAPPVPSNFTTITPLVMTPHCHAPSCIRHYLPLEVKGATGPLGFMTLSFTPFGRSSHVTHQYLAFFYTYIFRTLGG